MSRRTKDPSAARARLVTRLLCGCTFALSLASCVGEVSEIAQSSATAGEPGAGEGADPDAPVDCNVVRATDAPLRRLSPSELDNTLRDLLAVPEGLAARLPSESGKFGFESDSSMRAVTAPIAQAYMLIAEDVSERATADLAALVPCDTSTGERCAAEVIASFCPRAYRRPCEADELEGFLAMFRAGAEGADFRMGIRYVLETALQSPDFLYRPELGDAARAKDGAVPLTSYELATRLSYALWGTMPDAALLAAADEGKLESADDMRREAGRMLADDRAQDTVVRFNQEWLGLLDVRNVQKQADMFPDFESVRADMATESATFIADAFASDGDLTTLLAAPYTFVNDRLATFYGLPPPGSGEEFVRVDLDATKHAGILTQGAFMSVTAKANQTSPVVRGVTVLKQVLCGSYAPPPPDANTTPPDVALGGTTRTRFEAHEKDPACASCHKSFDALGFAFEHFDPVGRYRDEENGLPVDARAELTGTDVDAPYDGAAELAALLADSEQVRECYAKQLFHFTFGRVPARADLCLTAQLGETFEGRELGLRELLIQLTQSDAFMNRTSVEAP